MKYLSLPDNATRILPFYLAMEEYAARILGEEDIFFMWQVDPTVIFGRNQLIASEVNVDYCKEHGIAFYRRRSGGGCVYADQDNIMFSYITRSDEVQTTFSAYTTAVASMLHRQRPQRCAHRRAQSEWQRILSHARSQHRAWHHAV